MGYIIFPLKNIIFLFSLLIGKCVFSVKSVNKRIKHITVNSFRSLHYIKKNTFLYTTSVKKLRTTFGDKNIPLIK